MNNFKDLVKNMMIYTSPDSGNPYFPSLLRKDAQSEESDEIESVSSDLYDSCNSSNSGDSEEAQIPIKGKKSKPVLFHKFHSKAGLSAHHNPVSYALDGGKKNVERKDSSSSTIHAQSQTDLFADEKTQVVQDAKNSVYNLEKIIHGLQAEILANSSIYQAQHEESLLVINGLQEQVKDEKVSRDVAEKKLDDLKTRIKAFRDKVKEELCPKAERDALKDELARITKERNLFRDSNEKYQKKYESKLKEMEAVFINGEELKKTIHTLQTSLSTSDNDQKNLQKRLADEAENQNALVQKSENEKKALKQQLDQAAQQVKALNQTFDNEKKSLKQQVEQSALQCKSVKEQLESKTSSYLALSKAKSTLENLLEEYKLDSEEESERLQEEIEELKSENELMEKKLEEEIQNGIRLQTALETKSLALQKLEKNALEKDEIIQNLSNDLNGAEIKYNSHMTLSTAVIESKHKEQIATVGNSLQQVAEIQIRLDKLSQAENRCALSTGMLKRNMLQLKEKFKRSQDSLDETRDQLNMKSRLLLDRCDEIANLKTIIEDLKYESTLVQQDIKNMKSATESKIQEFQSTAYEGINSVELKMREQESSFKTEIDQKQTEITRLTESNQRLDKQLQIANDQFKKASAEFESSRNQLSKDLESLKLEKLEMTAKIQLVRRSSILTIEEATLNREELEIKYGGWIRKEEQLYNQINVQRSKIASYIHFLNRALSLTGMKSPEFVEQISDIESVIEDIQTRLLKGIESLKSKSSNVNQSVRNVCSGENCTKVVSRVIAEAAMLKRQLIIQSSEKNGQKSLISNDRSQENVISNTFLDDLSQQEVLAVSSPVKSSNWKSVKDIFSKKTKSDTSVQEAIKSLASIKSDLTLRSQSKLQEWSSLVDVISSTAKQQDKTISDLRKKELEFQEKQQDMDTLLGFINFLEGIYGRTKCTSLPLIERIDTLYRIAVDQFYKLKEKDQAIAERDSFVVAKLEQIKQISSFLD